MTTGASLPPRILIVNLSARRRGMADRSLRLASGLPGRAALAVLRHSPLHLEAERRGIETHTVGARAFDPRIASTLGEVLRREHFDVVDAHDLPALVWASRAVRRNRVPLVATVQDVDRQAHQSPLTAELFRRTDAAAGIGVDRFVAADPPARDALLRRGVSKDRIVVLPGAVTADVPIDLTNVAGAVDDDPRAWLFDRFGTPPDVPLIVAAGRLIEGKGHPMLIEAMGLLARRSVDLRAHLLLFGVGALRQELMMASVSEGVSGRVTITPFVDQDTFRRALSVADTFVHPGRVNELPSSLVEAASLRRPLVATAIAGVADVFSPNDALLVPPGDPEALATAIETHLADPEAALRFGDAAGVVAETAFSEHQLIESMSEIYRDLAQPS